MALILENGQVLAGKSVLTDVSVLIEDGLITSIAPADSNELPVGTRIDLEGRRLVPGFVDIQVNGGGGVLLNNAPTIATLQTMADTHARFGATSILPTLISDDFVVMRTAIAAVREAIDMGVPGIVGIHLEGPFLNPARKGAHDAGKFRALDDEAIEILTSLGTDAVTLVTLAPELTTRGQISELVSSGLIVFAGHTAACYEDCVAAEKAGLSGYTHLFNAMTPFASREPGVVGAAIGSTDAVFGIIADGYHVHPASVSLACKTKYDGGAILVTDAMPTVGSEKSGFELNGEWIEVVDGVLRNSAGSLAGSNLTMIEAVRNCMTFAGFDWTEAVRMASSYPARAIGCAGSIGEIGEGARADLVELTDDLDVYRVWRGGEEFVPGSDFS